MGNCVEDRFESDEVARAAYALDRMSPSEIAKIISGDKREAVMRALAEQFSSEQVEAAMKSMPSISVTDKFTPGAVHESGSEIPCWPNNVVQLFAGNETVSYNRIVRLKSPIEIPFQDIKFIEQHKILETYSKKFEEYTRDQEAQTVITTSNGHYISEKSLTELSQEFGDALKRSDFVFTSSYIGGARNWIIHQTILTPTV
jgi:hypothetical protein